MKDPGGRPGTTHLSWDKRGPVNPRGAHAPLAEGGEGEGKGKQKGLQLFIRESDYKNQTAFTERMGRVALPGHLQRCTSVTVHRRPFHTDE